MALAKGVNSNADVSEADLYFEDRLDADIWTNASPLRKGQALVTATSLLDTLTYCSVSSSSSQTIAFPMLGTYYEPNTGLQTAMDPTPTRVIKATFEMALHLLTNANLLDRTGDVQSLNAGSVGLINIRNAPVIPLSIKNILRPLLDDSASSGIWWKAN